MKHIKLGIGFLAIMFFVSMVYAVEFSPQGNINMKDRYNITNISAIVGGFSFLGNLTLPSGYWIDADTESENVKSPPANPGTGYAMSYFNDNFSVVTASYFNIDGQNWMGDFDGMGYNLTNTSLTSSLITNNENLAAYLAFEDGVGTLAYDGSSNGNDGEFTNMNSGKDNGTSGWTTSGKYGGAGMFDGVDDYVDCGNDASLNITSEITLSAWVKYKGTGSSGSYEYIINKQITSGYSLGVYSSTRKVIMIVDSAAGDKYVVSDVSVKDNEWSHIVGIFKNLTLYVYVDGVEKSQATTLTEIGTTSAHLSIGSRIGLERVFNGTIDEVKIWNRTLSADEIIDECYLGALSHNPEGHLFQKTGGEIDGNIDLNSNSITEVGALTATANLDIGAYSFEADTFTDGTGTITAGDGYGWDDWNVTELYATTLYQAGTALSSIYCALAGCTMAGTINMNNNIITNIGNAGTDFTSTGGLDLAGTNNMSAGAIIQHGYSLNFTNSTNDVAGCIFLNDTGFYMTEEISQC